MIHYDYALIASQVTIYSAVHQIRRRGMVARIRSGRQLLHWWARPHAVTAAISIPLFIICASLPDEQFLIWKHAQNLVTPYAFDVALVAIGGFALAAFLSSRIGTNRGLVLGIEAGRLIRPAQYRALMYIVLALTLAAYVLLLGPAIRNPSIAMQVYSAQMDATEARERLGQIPGITSFVNLGPLYATMLLLQARLTGRRLTRVDKAIFLVFLLVVLVRVFLWSERLALMEALVPVAIIRLSPIGRHRVLVSMLPVLGIIGLGLFFGVTEYFRSWAHFYSETDISLVDFVTTRLFGYYATAINNGAAIFSTFEPLYIPYNIASWFFNFPGLSFDAAWTADVFERRNVVFWGLANPEFNNVSGLFAPMIDLGAFGGIAVWILLGVVTGRLYRGFTAGRLIPMMLFPSWMTGVYEVLRIFYFGGQRYFPVLALAPVICWLLAHSTAERRGYSTAMRSPYPKPGSGRPTRPAIPFG